MSQLFNQFSYPLFAAAALALTVVILRRRVAPRVLLAASCVVALAFIIGFFALRTGDGDTANVENYATVIQNGRPTFIEFYSNYCTACLLARPAVDRLVADIAGDFNILRVNVHGDGGQPVVAAYGFRYTPEFILLDTDGAEIWRGHTTPESAVIAAASAQ